MIVSFELRTFCISNELNYQTDNATVKRFELWEGNNNVLGFCKTKNRNNGESEPPTQSSTAHFGF